MLRFSLILKLTVLLKCATGFQMPTWRSTTSIAARVSPILADSSVSNRPDEATSSQADDPIEIVARRIVVKGNVQGGYYRACVLNEASRFRRLVGTMTPPDDSDIAEIYVEGKRKLVDSFTKWCRRSDVGLSQVITVVDIIDEEPTGLYDGFYIKTR